MASRVEDRRQRGLAGARAARKGYAGAVDRDGARVQRQDATLLQQGADGSSQQEEPQPLRVGTGLALHSYLSAVGDEETRDATDAEQEPVGARLEHGVAPLA